MTKAADLKRKLERVLQVGLSLARSDDLQHIVQLATDVGRELCGAQFGAFFYNVTDAGGESFRLYTLSGATPEDFDKFPQPRNTQVFGPTFEGRSSVRSGDITKDPRYGHNPPYYGMPEGHPPVRSFLSVPVKTLTGETLGGLFFGHGNADMFDQESEDLIFAIASQAAVAIENARLREDLNRKIEALEAADVRRREAAKRLNQLAAIIQYSEDAIISKDLTGRVTSWNPAATRILGYSAEEMIGESILKIIPPELHGDEDVILDNIRNGRSIEHFETVRLTKAGERIDVALTISPLRDESGQIVGASKILRDVSAQKRMANSLLQAEKIAATGKMAATIAHEINNPLEAVVNLLFLARERAVDSEQLAYLSAADREIARVSHIARQTLGYYRENASAVSVSLTSLLNDALRIYKPRCDANGIRVETRFESQRKVIVRKGEMMQVISNLVTNAIYAMPRGGVLTLTILDEPNSIALCVEDTGEGIPADALPHIFDAFFTTRKTIGTGIGLFIAKQFVEGHGGRIKIESSTDAEAHGTKVTVNLPLENQYSAG
ncbi:MAG TPA: PAS domain S-box protein [Acidobacteriaceae bacterium]|nr:PAS domain S-box protein [Acidobacteriaceae bacterium]